MNLPFALDQIKSSPVLLLGDFFLDAYQYGTVQRISPEAPVPVFHAGEETIRPGGAGNVFLNLLSLSMQPIALGRSGDDSSGAILAELLGAKSILFREPSYPTPMKRRLIAGSQQLIRIDKEEISPLSLSLEEKVIEALSSYLPHVSILAISDYGKGFLTRAILQRAIEEARRLSIPAIVDPKGIDFSKYKKAFLLKPNLQEAYAASKLPSSAPLHEVAKVLLAMTEVDHLLITRSEHGMTLFSQEGTRADFPVESREVKDVTGAGDTVLATLSAALASNLPLPVAVQLANIAAGLAIERLGCAQITLADMKRRLHRGGERAYGAEALLLKMRGRLSPSLAVPLLPPINGDVYTSFES